MLKISEVSKKLNIPVATIRYYAEQDMIPSLKRNIENQRLFDDESIIWLEGIKFFRELGMPISEIKEYISLSQKVGKASLIKRNQLLIKQEKIAQENLILAQKNLEDLKFRIDLENKIIKGHKQDSLSPARRFNT